MAHVEQHPTYPLFRRKVGVVPDFTGANYIFQEVPTPAPDGVQRTFTLKHQPLPDSEMVFKDGMFMSRGDANDYTLTGNQITFAEPPPFGSVILVNYRYAGLGT
ncbi:hypothetical protein [Alicyclobacillus shizuokensis]|uniref:hypothetical protein n=1 Tax=Alicyclobacillus shizuokensis TaxID=392014 RepID=UPI00082A9AE7|nr:hypothetical protein [Alicyclobacillus shizuokensis]